jgi:hypothetical protein
MDPCLRKPLQSSSAGGLDNGYPLAGIKTKYPRKRIRPSNYLPENNQKEEKPEQSKVGNLNVRNVLKFLGKEGIISGISPGKERQSND